MSRRGDAPRRARAGIRAGALGQPGAAPPRRDCQSGADARLPRRHFARRRPQGIGRLVADRAPPLRPAGTGRSRRVMIPIARPVLDEEEAMAAREAVLSGWVTQGPQVAAFEREFAEQVGTAHACAVSSCTTALHLALVGLGIGPGNEVITPSHSFIATANVIRYCGATPVFVDIDPDTYNLDPEQVAAAVTPRTRAVLAVHQI